MISVIIPFYQQQAGILTRALSSIALQTCSIDMEILVVEDGSPVSGRMEVDAVRFPRHIRVRVIQKDNGGPSSARNVALDSMSGSTKYVAFLDSDDTWQPNHLERAVDSLQQGFDVYFSDIVALGGNSWFRAKERTYLWGHPHVDQLEGVHRFDGDMFDQIIEQTVLNTSTVVTVRSAIGETRFDESLFSAGEDQLFFLDLAAKGCRFCYSLQCEAAHGRGVNIHQDTRRGTTKEQVRLANELRYIKRVLVRPGVSVQQVSELKERLVSIRRAYVSDVLHAVRLRAAIDWRLQVRQLREDPATAIALPAAIARGIRAKLSCI